MNNILEILLNIKFQKYVSVSHGLKAVLVYQYLNSDIILWSINLRFFSSVFQVFGDQLKLDEKYHMKLDQAFYSQQVFFS